MSTTTFVTAFLDLQEDHNNKRPPHVRFEHFKTHIEANLKIVVFLSRRFEADFAPFVSENVRVVFIELEETDTFKTITKEPILPESRTPSHDTFNFLILMNAKTEFMARAIAMDPFHSTHFAWIDFSIAHVFKNRSASIQHLNMLQNTCLKSKCLAMPGCWNKDVGMSYIYNSVNWRFCGGFFIGDKESVLDFHTASYKAFKDLYETQNRIVWEVNTWAIAERNYGLAPHWFKVDHNDTIIQIPVELYKVVATLTTIPSRINDLYKTLESLSKQVDHIYVSIAESYKRFGDIRITVPDMYKTEPYCGKVTFVEGPDYGPASKYLGSLTALPPNTWVFVCDDDQVYHPKLIQNMLKNVKQLAVYQNRFETIKQTTSGGLIHGYVGLMLHSSHLANLSAFPLPECARYVDDQWMSTYLFFQNIPILKTGIEEYKDIYQILCGWHELIGADALGSLGNRSQKVAELADFFYVAFGKDGTIATRTIPSPQFHATA